MSRWFLPSEPDVIGLLADQAEVTVEGLRAFATWARGVEPSSAEADEVAAAEHAADRARRELQRALRTAFSTPLDAEDLFALSETLDNVINGAKNAVREAQVMGMAPDLPMAAMADQVLAGVEHLRRAFGQLTDDGEGATDAADAAIKSVRTLEREYRGAMSQLIDHPELREVIARRELYRRCSRLGEDVVAVADRVWYAVVKGG